MSLELHKFSQPGVFIQEADESLYTTPRDFGVRHLVIGTSRKGVHFNPVLVETPERFIEIFGDIDYHLEKRESYFHRTCLNLLDTGSVICMSIIETDEEKDFINYKSLSASSSEQNGLSRSVFYDDFFSKSVFWQRSKEHFLHLTNENNTDNIDRYFHVANLSDKPFSLFIIKSDISGFDIPFEDWYGSDNVPSYLHPKEWVSEYMIKVIAVKGDWTNYSKLSVHPVWSEFFTRLGLRKNKLNKFINHNMVNVIKTWDGSLIPYFKDSNDNLIYIESLINNDVNQTGVFVSLNEDLIEKDYKTKHLDIIGSSLSQNSSLDFFSYKENLLNEILLEEKEIDSPGNVWGTSDWDIGRSTFFAEGYVHGVKLKPLIISQTSTVIVRPLINSSNAYYIINGNRIDLGGKSPEYVLEIDNLLKRGQHLALSVIATSDGVDFRVGIATNINGSLFLPLINPSSEFVLGYYHIEKDLSGEYNTTLEGISVDTNGWISPFRQGNEPESKIDFINYSQQWRRGIKFENIRNYSGDNYYQARVLYYFNKLNQNLVEKESIVLDDQGFKRIIDQVIPSRNTNDEIISITSRNENANIQVANKIAIYFKDIEFIFQDEKHLETEPDPFTPGDGGIVGRESIFYKSYFEGTINTGDRVFLPIAEEFDLTFIQSKNNNDYIKFDNPPFEDYSNFERIYIQGTQHNDGIWDILSTNFIDNNYVIFLKQNVAVEYVNKIYTFNANQIRYLSFRTINDQLFVEYIKDPNDNRLFRDLEDQTLTPFKRTLEIEKVLSNQEVLVSAERYNNLEEGFFLLAETPQEKQDSEQIFRNWTRILEVSNWPENENYLYLKTDENIHIRDFYGDKQTDYFQEIDQWVNTYKAHALYPFVVKDHSIPDGSEEKQEKLLNKVSSNTRIFEGLTSDSFMDWRYLTDSYGLGIKSNSKKQLADICYKKGKLGFLNAPSIKQLKKKGKGIFTDNNDLLDVNKLVKGGSNTFSVNRFSLTKGLAGSHVAYFFPYVIDFDVRGRQVLPPASYVTKAFMNKWASNDSNAQPWTISAGAIWGILPNVIDVESSFTDSEMKILDNYNFNLIIRRNQNFIINNNNTSFDKKSDLSNIHVREMLMSLENELKNMLMNFQWSFHTAPIRSDIEERANEICISFVERGGIINFTNIMNINNNPPELIDNQIGFLETFVQPLNSMQSLVLNMAVLSTGGVETVQR